MTTSGVSTFTLTRDDAITMAMRKMNVIGLGETPDVTSITQANMNLNVMLKAWQTEGLKLWTVNELVIPYVTGQSSYTIGPSSADVINPRPLKVIQAFLRNNSVSPATDTTITIVSKQEYNMLGSKLSTGQTNTIFYDPLIPNGILYTYLVPDATTSTNFSLHVVYQRPIMDMIASTDNFDLPAEWMQAIVWGLADELAQDYQVPLERMTYIGVKAAAFKEQLNSWDVEASATFFSPDYRSQYQSWR